MDANILKLERRPWVSTDPRDKVRTIEELGTITQRLRQSGKVVIQAHGTFDLFAFGPCAPLGSSPRPRRCAGRYRDR